MSIKSFVAEGALSEVGEGGPLMVFREASGSPSGSKEMAVRSR